MMVRVMVVMVRVSTSKAQGGKRGRSGGPLLVFARSERKI